MSGFLFTRRTSQDDPAPPPPAPPAPDTDRLLKEAGRAQAITAAGIFAALVSKGILSPREAAELMSEIGDAIERDVGGGLGNSAGDTLRSYGRALLAADS